VVIIVAVDNPVQHKQNEKWSTLWSREDSSM